MASGRGSNEVLPKCIDTSRGRSDREIWHHNRDGWLDALNGRTQRGGEAKLLVSISWMEIIAWKASPSPVEWQVDMAGRLREEMERL